MLFSNARQELLILEHENFLPQLVQFLFLFLFPLYPHSRFQEMLIVEHPLAISVFCLWFLFVFPMPSLLFSTAMQFVTNGLQCLPQLVHFLHFLLVSTLPSPKFYTQALDQKENKPRPRAKSQGPKAKGKGPRAKGKGPRAKAKGQKSQRQMTQGQPRLLEKLHFAKNFQRTLHCVCNFGVATAKVVLIVRAKKEGRVFPRYLGFSQPPPLFE